MKQVFSHKIERSSSSHAILETGSRKRKAEKIRAVLTHVTEINKLKILDIGTGSGHIAHELSKYAKELHSIDIVDERKEKRGYKFMLAKSEKLPYPDSSFDLVITNHVVEHTPAQQLHLDEIIRVLRPGGYVYLATPNKYWLTDPHYKLPFISWLPRSASSFYLKVTQKHIWDIHPLSPHGLKKMLRGTQVINALPILLTSSAAEKLDTWKFATKVAKFIPTPLLSLTQYVSPTLIYLVKKSD